MITISLETAKGTSKRGFDPAGRVADLEAKISDFRPAMKHALKLMVENQEELFTSAGASAGVKWKPYTSAERQKYLPYKDKILGGSNLPMLRWSKVNSKSKQTGERLYPSMIMQTGTKGKEYIAEAFTHGFEFGTRVPYAVNHQLGRGSYRGYKIPKRKILAMSEDTAREILRAMQAHVFGGKFTSIGSRG